MADKHLPRGFVMIVGSILDTFETILGHVGAILTPSWEDYAFSNWSRTPWVVVIVWSHFGRTAVSRALAYKINPGWQTIIYPLVFLMIVGAILDIVEAILCHIGTILALSWEDLGPLGSTLGLANQHLKNRHTLLKGVMEPRPWFAYNTNVII